jgi:hypothetical protein
MRGQYYAYPILCGDGPRMRGQHMITCTNLNLGAAFISSGLAGWFDASDTSTMTLTGSRVDQWRDKNGSGTLFETVAALGTSFNPVRTSTLFGNRGGVVFTTGGKYLQSPTGMGLNGTTGWTVLFALSRTSRNGFWQTTDFNRNSMMSVFTGERFGASVGSGLRYGVPRNIPFVNGVVNTGSQYKFVRNGIAYDRDQGSFTPSAGALANLQLGGWQGTASPGAFDLAGAFYWNRVLTATELVQMDAWIRNNYGISPVPEPTWNIVVHGNSHTLGVGGTNVATMNEGILAANGSPLATDWLAMGTSGITTPTLASEAAARVDVLYNSSIAAAKRVLIFWEGTNHIAGTVSAVSATFYDAIKNYCIDRKTANPNWKIVVGTIMPRGGSMANSANYEAVRLAVNVSIRAAKLANETWLDAVADVGGDATIGVTGANANATYFSADQIHLTDAGHTIAATYFRDAINSVTGL